MEMSSANISGFFDLGADINNDTASGLTLLSDSTQGPFVLYKYSKAGRIVVLKALREQLRGDALSEEMLRKEYEIGRSLNHPNIREYYSYGPVGDLGNCIEMEWVDGQSLEDLMPRCREDSELCDRIASQMLEAVKFIHLKQVIHRDLKPSNILITDKGHNVKVIDFSLSDSDSHFVLKGNAGTALYASPEQTLCKGSDSRSDIYSLGVILSEMSARRRYRTVALRCMRKDPARRYQEVDELSSALFRRSWGLPLSLVLLLLTVIACAAAILGKPEPAPIPDGQLPEMLVTPGTENAELPEEEEYLDAGSIDLIFRQATEMLEEGGVTEVPAD